MLGRPLSDRAPTSLQQPDVVKVDEPLVDAGLGPSDEPRLEQCTEAPLHLGVVQTGPFRQGKGYERLVELLLGQCDRFEEDEFAILPCVSDHPGSIRKPPVSSRTDSTV